jgi:ABC-type iron transport system FetAB ATPase subunit
MYSPSLELKSGQESLLMTKSATGLSALLRMYVANLCRSVNFSHGHLTYQYYDVCATYMYSETVPMALASSTIIRSLAQIPFEDVEDYQWLQ